MLESSRQRRYALVRRLETADPLLEQFGQPQRGAVLEHRTDELHPDRQALRGQAAGTAVAGRPGMVASPAQTSWSKYGWSTPSTSMRRSSGFGLWSCGNAGVGVIGQTTASNSVNSCRQPWRWTSRRLFASIHSWWLHSTARNRTASRL